MDENAPIAVTLDPVLSRWAEHLVAIGQAPSVSAVINNALAESYARHRWSEGLLRKRARHADQLRVRRMRDHADAQAATLGLSGGE
jgi:Arc/MetJ-type ribon-helix-helix transcriptional regulator